MILTDNSTTSPLSAAQAPPSPPSVLRTSGLSRSDLDRGKDPALKTLDIPRRRMGDTEFQTGLPPRNEDDNNLRRVCSDNLAQSKREDPSVRRSIFGHYFKEKPRSISAPHLERGQPQSPPPPPSPPQQTEQQQTTSSRPNKRSSLPPILSSPLLPSSPKKRENRLAHNGSRRHHIHDHPSTQAHHPVDYRVFAPSQKQVSESAICNRYRELNREHEKEYDSLLERQVQVEHSLPPFPTPLIRFCSETTATVAEHEACSASKNHNDNKSYFVSPDGEMHYHGVYSLLKPCSILKPSSYSLNKSSPEAEVPMIDSSNDIAAQSGLEEVDHHLTSFNFPRSYIESAAILNQFSSTATDTGSASNIGEEGEEEKKETDSPFISVSSAPDALLLSNNGVSECSRQNTDTLDNAPKTSLIAKECSSSDSKEDNSETLQALHQSSRHFRFDPRVTVTEFEDPVPRKWYQECELEQHKREAIALAQAYLRKNPAVAEWYRQAMLDPITKTHRKRALFSLPVFSSSYSPIESDLSPLMTTDKKDIRNLEESLTKTSRNCPVLQRQNSLPSPVKRILVVHPNPKIASLFCKSMKSMFCSAQLVSTGCPEEALRLIQESLAAPHTTDNSPFDIIIVEQLLDRPDTSKRSKWEQILKNPLGFCTILMKDEGDESSPNSSPTCVTRCGSELIHLVHELSCCNDKDRYEATVPPSFIIGVSMHPKRDAPCLKRAGADIVWGIPIPKVGNTLRNKLVSGLLAKRSSHKASSSTQ